MICDKCGNQMPDNARFCTVCGNAFIDVEAEATTVLRVENMIPGPGAPAPGGNVPAGNMYGGVPGGNMQGNNMPGGNVQGADMSGGNNYGGTMSTGLVPMRSSRRKEEIVVDYVPGGDYIDATPQYRDDRGRTMPGGGYDDRYDEIYGRRPDGRRTVERVYPTQTPQGGYVGQVQYGNGYGVNINYDNDFGRNDGYSGGLNQQGHPQGNRGQADSGRRPAQSFPPGNSGQQKSSQNYQRPPKVQPKQSAAKPAKKSATPFIIIGIVAAVLIAAVVAGYFIFKDKIRDYMAKSDVTYVYVAEGEYKYISDVKKGITTGFDEVGSDDLETFGFDPTRKYLYYFSKYDDEAQKGVLKRIPVNKLGKSAEKNKDLSEEIASKVSGIYGFMPDGTFFYIKEEAMYYFDGRTSKKLDKNVSNLISDSKGECIVYQINDNDDDADGNKLYYAEIKDFNNRILLADGVSNHTITKKGLIFYTKSYHDDDYNYYLELYVTDKNKNTKLISDDVDDYMFDTDCGQVFYTIENGKKIDPSDEYSGSLVDLYLYDGSDSKLISSNNKKVMFTYGNEYGISATSISENGDCRIDYTVDSKSYTFSDELSQILTSDLYVYNVKTGPAYYDYEKDILYMCSISGGKVELADKITDVLDIDKGIEGMYYLQYTESKGDDKYGDIYLYKDGKTEIVAAGVKDGDTAVLYADGTVVDYTDDDEAVVMNPGKKLEFEIKDRKGDVIYRSPSDFYYISDGDLYHYNGKTDKLIDSYVERIICSYELTPVAIF